MDIKFTQESDRKVYFNKIACFDDGDFWVLEVGSLKAPEKSIGYEFEGSERVTAEAFKDVYTGLEPGSDGKMYVWEVLKAHIEQYWLFNLPSNSVIPYHDCKDNHTKKISRLTNVLHAIYNERDFRNIDGLDVACRHLYPTKYSVGGEMEAFSKSHRVYNLTRDFLYNKLEGSSDGTGKINIYHRRYKQNDLQIAFRDGYFYWTAYNELLEHIIGSINGFHKADKNSSKGRKDSLRVTISTEEYGKATISLAEIVWAVGNKLISEDLLHASGEEVKSALMRMHKQFPKDFMIDHLSENVFNNYLEFLAPTTKGMNTSLGNRRTKIKDPYFWYMVNDTQRGKILVHCGVQGTDFQWYYTFDTLADCEDCFNEFTQIAKECKCMAGRNEKLTADECSFAYWTQVPEYHREVPDMVNDPNNPVLALLKKPLEEFSTYVNGDLNDMPRICKNE